MKRIVTMLIVSALSIFNVNICRAADQISNPFVKSPDGVLEIMMLDPSIEYIDVRVDEDFILNNHSLYYKVSTPSIVNRFNSEIPKVGSKEENLPEWYRFVPEAVLKFSNAKRYLYDGCYIQILPGKNYYLASEKMRGMLDQLSFSKHQDCENPETGRNNQRGTKEAEGINPRP